MTLQQLKYVVTVAECGNITEAAKQLFVSQPTVTSAIHDLEKEMQIVIFIRTNKGVILSEDGERFLGHARQVLEQVDLIEGIYKDDVVSKPHFAVSCQHYSFAVNAFVDVIREFDAYQYDFTIREEQTHEIIEDVTNLKSELGVIYLSSKNTEVLSKMLKRNELEFTELFTATPHVFICDSHPLASKKSITMDDLQDYPYLTYEQGEYNSQYFSEEFVSTLDSRKNIRVRDRATLFNLIIGLNGYTVCSGGILIMLSIYPACFFKEDNGYSVIFPDLNYLATQGDTLEDAVAMAVDCLAGYLYTAKMDNEKFPKASKLSDINIDRLSDELDITGTYTDAFTNMVSVDVKAYAKEHFDKSVRKTLTIPAWLNTAAQEEGINFSKTLQEALMSKLKAH